MIGTRYVSLRLQHHLVHDWNQFVVHLLDPNTGAQTHIGSLNKRQFAYLASSVDFGGNAGVQQRVLVIEEEQSGTLSCPDGSRLERYFFLQGLGHVRQQGWANGSATECADPAYVLQNDSFFNWRANVGDYNLPVDSPIYNTVNWW